MINILRIIKEEVQNFFNHEPSIADTYYEKRLGIDTTSKNYGQENTIGLQPFGYATETWRDKKLPKPVPIYKNPKSLTEFASYVRGILMENGDFYTVQNGKDIMHADMIRYLMKEGIISDSKAMYYANNYPQSFIAVETTGEKNNFSQSVAYHNFPEYYQVLFDQANKKFPNFSFTVNKDEIWNVEY